MAGLPVNNTADNIRDDATIGFDAEGRVMSASAPAALALGYTSPEDLQGLALSSLIGSEAAGAMLRAMRNRADEDEEMLDDDDQSPSGPVTFRRRDGTRVSMRTVITPETSGGWITLVRSARESGRPSAPSALGVRAALRLIARSTSSAETGDSLTEQLAKDLREALGAETVIIARSTAAPGLYEPVSVDSDTLSLGAGDSFDLPSALVPGPGAPPLAVDSADRLALFEPAIIGGSELTGAYMATRVDTAPGVHLLLIATERNERAWSDDATLIYEATSTLVSSAFKALELRGQAAEATRSTETVRQVGLLAAKEPDETFLSATRRVLARRMPVVALAVHGIETVTSRSYVIASSAAEGISPLSPEPEWQLGGSLEQHVFRTGAPVTVSAGSRERVSVQPAMIAHWRHHGLRAVIAVPLRDSGQVVATLTAGFAGPLASPQEAIRILESIAPAVQVGAGLSGGKPAPAKQPDHTADDPGYVDPELLLALTRAASESPDAETLFASITEWLLEILPSARVACGAIRPGTRAYQRVYTFEPASAGLPDDEELDLTVEEFDSLKTAGLGLPEPGKPGDGAPTVRCPVVAGQRTVGVVTVWPHDGESFSINDLARLQRVCGYISGPLARITETESVREAQAAREQVAMIGSQMASFIEPAQAFRSSRAQLTRLFPNDRILFLEFDHTAGVARAVYDSAAAPGTAARPQETLISALPVPAVASAQEPVVASLNTAGLRKGDSLFAGMRTLLSVPVTDTDGTAASLLFLSADPDTYAWGRRDLASALSSHLTGAFATWQAYRSSKEWTNELRETRKQLNSILGSAPVALINIDNNGVCTRLEGHGLMTLGIKREEMLGRSIFELTGKLPQFEDAIRQALRGIPAGASAMLGLKAAEVWAQPVISVDGIVIGVTVVGYDVSERIRSRRARSEVRELQAVNRQRTRFISSVSHELRNPLQSIMFYADILSANSSESLTKQQAQALSVIQNSSSRLDALIKDLLDLSRLDTGDFALELSVLDVTGFMRDIVDTQKPQFEGAGQKLELDAPKTAGMVQADQLRLTQVITNLLSNASKFSPKGTTVAVSVATQGTNIRISVADTGPGIPKDHLDKVFDAGYRVESEQTRSVPGTGLGLAIAKRITELHGGKISLESEIGKGTKVTISLPTVKVEDIPAAEATQEDAQAKRRRPRAKAG
jgi:PAS domain S-box-containing protein